MYTVEVNAQSRFEFENTRDGLRFDGNLVTLDSVKTGERSFHVLHNNISYQAEIIELNKEDKTCLVKVNGNMYSLKISDQFDSLLHQLGMDNLLANKLSDLKAPMPGLVLKVLVEPGMAIKKGENLLVLEAMKMENIIKAPADATVKTVKISPSDKVEKNQVLITFE